MLKFNRIRFNKNSLRYILVFIIFFLCLCLTIYAASRNYSHARQKLHDQVVQDAAVRHSLASRELKQIRVNLISVQNFSQYTARMSRQDFKNFCAPILSENASLLSIAIIPKVTGGDREKYEEEARKDGPKDYQFKQWGSSGELVKAAKRDEYYPVFFIEPEKSSFYAGLDLGSDKDIRKALEKASESGAPATVDYLIPPRGKGDGDSILICLPVYVKGQAVATDEQRKSALLGYIIGVFKPDNIVAPSGIESPAMRISVLDAPPGTVSKAVDSKAPAKWHWSLWSQKLSADEFTQEYPFLFGDHTWHMMITPTDDYLHRHFQPYPWLIVLIGVILSALIAYIAASRHLRSHILIRFRSGRNAARSQGDSIYRPLFEQSRYGIIMCDLSWSILNANEAFLNLTGFTREDLEMLTVRDFTPPSWHAKEDDVIRSQVLPLGFSGLYEKEFQRVDGTTFKAVLQTWLMKDDATGDPMGLTTWVEESSGKEIAASKAARLATERLESMQRIAQYSSDSLQDLYDITLEEALRITGSGIGHIYSYSEETQELTLNSWSKEVMNECFVLDKQTTYRLGTSGLWGESIRRREYVLVNDYNAPHEAKMGLPPGHLPLKNFLSVPLIIKKKIVGLIGVANKKNGDYDEDDVRELTLLMHTLWHNVDRKRVEDRLRDLEKQYRILSENTRDVVWKLDMMAGRITYISPSIERLAGYTQEEALKLSPEQMFAPSSHDFLKESLPARIKAFQAGENFMRTQVYLLEQLHRDGTVIPVEVVSKLVPSSQGEIAEIIVISRDMTDRIQNEHALNESNNMIRDLLDQLPYGVAWKNSDLVYLGCNTPFIRIAGLQAPDDIVGRDDSLLPWSAEAEALHQIEMNTISTDTPAQYELSVTDNNGESQKVSLTILPLKDSSGQVTGIVQYTSDISAYKCPEPSFSSREENSVQDETESDKAES